MTMAVALHFQIDKKCVQRIVPSNDSERFEGVDFSRSGDVLAVATSESNSVLLFRRKPTAVLKIHPSGPLADRQTGSIIPMMYRFREAGARNC